MSANAIRAKILYTQNLTNIGYLGVKDEARGILLFMISSEAVPNIREKMRDLNDTGDFKCSCVFFGQSERENVIYLLERTENPQNAYDDFCSLLSDWMKE